MTSELLENTVKGRVCRLNIVPGGETAGEECVGGLRQDCTQLRAVRTRQRRNARLPLAESLAGNRAVWPGNAGQGVESGGDLCKRQRLLEPCKTGECDGGRRDALDAERGLQFREHAFIFDE